jgi:hypothetical protein
MTFDHAEWAKRLAVAHAAREKAWKAVAAALAAERQGKRRNERTFRPLCAEQARTDRAYEALLKEREDYYAMRGLDALGRPLPDMPTIVEEDSMVPVALIFPTRPTGEDT